MDDWLKWMTKFKMEVIIDFLQGTIADCNLLLHVSQRNSTLATQPSRVLVWQSRMISPSTDLTMILFQWSLVIFFPCKSSHVRDNRFAPALGGNFTGHIVCTCSVLSTCQMLIQSFPFFVVSMFLELPWINSLMSITSNRPVLSFAMWHNTPESPIHVFLMNKNMFTHQWYTSYLPL